MKEYFADISLTHEIESWFILQGAKVTVSNAMPLYDSKSGNFTNDKVDVYFGHRKMHYYAVERGHVPMVRVFFNEDTISTALILLIKWPTCVIRHNVPEKLYEN